MTKTELWDLMKKHGIPPEEREKLYDLLNDVALEAHTQGFNEGFADKAYD